MASTSYMGRDDFGCTARNISGVGIHDFFGNKKDEFGPFSRNGSHDFYSGMK